MGLLRRHLSSERLAEVVGRVDMLPSAPKAFQEILACLQRPNASVADAAKIIAGLKKILGTIEAGKFKYDPKA